MLFYGSIASAIVIFTLYRVSVILYRLFLHPLRKIPGPKFAAATTLYETYYDLVRGGTFTFKIRDLHRQHGPIIRIAPDEVHVLDPNFIDKVYSMQGHWDKNQGYKRYDNLGHLTAIPHAYHRSLRAPLNPFFSKQRIAALEPRIQATIPRMQRRLDDFVRSGIPLDVELFFNAVTMDVASEYAMGKAYGNLDMADFNKHYHGMIPRMGPIWCLSKQLPWLISFFNSIPSSWMRKLEPGLTSFNDFGNQCELEIRSIMSMLKASGYSKESADPDKSPTIFHALLSNPDLRETDDTIRYLRDEAISIIGAGTITTATTMTVMLFHLSHNRTATAKLRQELSKLAGDRPLSLQQIERLPYLNAVILEALRMMPGGPNRVGRIAVDHATTYSRLANDGHTVIAEYIIPPGYEMSMTQWQLSHNEEVFDNPHQFKPERWADASESERRSLESAFAPFVKGTRNCLGMNLAYAELRLLTAAVVSGPFDFVPFESQVSDMDLVAESGPAPIVRKQFRVIVKQK